MRDRAESPVAPTEVLYVDSDADFAQLVERSLTRLDPTVSVTHVDSAAAAFAVIAGEDPSGATLDEDHPTTTEPTVDCVVSAYALRDADAVSFLESFRRPYPDLPFVLFTGAGSESVASNAIAAGVSAYVPVRAGENNFELLAQRIWTVTQGYRAKRRAEATAAELRRAYHRTGEAVVAVNCDSTVLFGNETFLSEYDLDGDEVAGESLWQVVPAFAGTAVESATRRVVDSREPETVEVETDERVLSVRVFPDDDGGAIVYADDVTERERAVVRNDCRAAVANGVGTPALVVEETSTILFANDPARRHLGVSPRPESGDGPALATVVAEPDADRVDSAVQTVLGRARRDGGVTTADGSVTVSGTVGETTRVVEAVGLPSAETVADVRVEPVTVADEPHALVVVVDRER